MERDPNSQESGFSNGQNLEALQKSSELKAALIFAKEVFAASNRNDALQSLQTLFLGRNPLETESFLHHLIEVVQLKDGWDGAGSYAVNPDLATQLLAIVGVAWSRTQDAPLPQPVPVRSGGIDAELLYDGKVIVVSVDADKKIGLWSNDEVIATSLPFEEKDLNIIQLEDLWELASQIAKLTTETTKRIP